MARLSQIRTVERTYAVSQLSMGAHAARVYYNADAAAEVRRHTAGNNCVGLIYDFVSLLESKSNCLHSHERTRHASMIYTHVRSLRACVYTASTRKHYNERRRRRDEIENNVT